jgi:hypothetical protein
MPRPIDRTTDRKIRSVVLAGPPRAAAVPICTIVRAPSGGWTAVLHPSDCDPPVPSPDAVTFPDVGSATRYARAQYPSLYVEVADDDQPTGAPMDQPVGKAS